VDEHPTFSLRQLKDRMEKDYSTTISISTVDRLLDGQHYSLKKVTIQPMERNKESTKIKRADYARWLQMVGPSILRLYIDETNYNIWCSRSRGRSKISQNCVLKLPSNKGPNLNILACCSAAGILEYECHSKLTWHLFNKFLEKCSNKISQEQPGVEAVFIFDNAPIHKRADGAILCVNHTFKYLSPYSPMFNSMEEVFSKFKQVNLTIC
jgi:hypothetical protein